MQGTSVKAGGEQSVVSREHFISEQAVYIKINAKLWNDLSPWLGAQG
jgi:hypothetical protein